MKRRKSQGNLDRLQKWFSSYNSCLVAFSGGVDSSLLAHAAHQVLDAQAIAVTSLSPSFASSEVAVAREVANEIGIELLTVCQEDLQSPEYVANQVSRCYFCRRNLVDTIRPLARERSIEVCVDGTHLDDMFSPRPGVKALREAGFRAPYVELKFDKSDIREMAAMVGLSNAQRPSEACLASRIAYGQIIDQSTLALIERSEEFVKHLTGSRIVRVRTIGSRAVVEVERSSVECVLKSLDVISRALVSFGYSSVEIDPEGYKEGKMLSLLIEQSR